MLTANSIRVNETDRNEIVLCVEVSPVGYSERLMGDRVPNGTPHIDDADASFQKTVCVFAQVAMHACNAGIECLIDVNALL